MPTAVIAMVIRDGKVLLIQHATRYSIELPGGRVEEGEGHIEALIREVMEETGVWLDSEGITPIHYTKGLGARRDYDGWFYRCAIHDGEPRPGSDAHAAFFGDPEILQRQSDRYHDYLAVRKALQGGLPMETTKAEPKPTPSVNGAVIAHVSVAGTIHHATELHLVPVKPGDVLTLKREPTNPHDPYAIEVFHKEQKIGYVPATLSRIIGSMLDLGYPIVARVGKEVVPVRSFVSMELIAAPIGR